VKEIIVDNFAGGGGASTGIELATGESVDIAINHDPEAIKMHKINHPTTEHYCESVWDVDPIEACKGRPVGLAWFSPDCKHFSKAKGGKPVEKKIRGLAWIVLKWAGKVRPRVIILENVEEFQTWGPVRKGKPIKAKKGDTYRQWKSQLENLGYTIETKELWACDYGAPTKRKRFFMIARCDGKAITWPDATHGHRNDLDTIKGLVKPYVAASQIMNWNNIGRSIFGRKIPLKDKTLSRIAKGIQKFIIENDDRFIVTDKNASAFLIQYHSETNLQHVRGQMLKEPLMTIDSSPRYALVTTFLTKFYKTGIGQDIKEPLHTVTTSPGHFGLVSAFLVKYYGNMTAHDVREPLDTITTRDRFGLVTVAIDNQTYSIEDIYLRMLEPKELFAAQGFPDDYIIDRDITGKIYPKSEQVKRCGNAVPPPFANALVRSNLPELCTKQRRPNLRVEECQGQLKFA
jgi:DNA (cytosine-5)-methyltransferase 1